ncbi:MAG: DUF3987 domain-containing protein [Acidobacteria bacterium]|nr:DUF3987 domain-containing protein [Acidobacteriota bacterium]
MTTAAIIRVPDSLAELDQWILWRYEQRDSGKPTKVPNQINGSHASSTDTKTWCSWGEALKAWQEHPRRWSGIGFVFSPRDPFFGIDLDQCLDDAEQLKPWAQPIMERFTDTYSEVSPSGRGIKIWGKGRLPGGGAAFPLGDGRVEIYDQARYFTVTGNHWRGQLLDVEEHQADLDWLLALSPHGQKKIPSKLGEGKIRKGSQHDTLVSLAGSMRRRGMGVDEIEAALQVTNATRLEEPAPAQNIKRIAASIGAYAPGDNRGPDALNSVGPAQNWDWPEPVPFRRRNTPTLPADLLPGFLGDMASATARATETPMELAAMLGLAVVAASVAKKVVVCPEPGYVEPVNIYTAVAMESGNRKTAVLNGMTRPFIDWEMSEAHRLKPEISRIASERKTQEARIESLRKQAAKSSNHTELMAQVAEMELSLPQVPIAPRLWTQDVTPERLGALMAEQGERIALLSDEGGIFDVLAGRYSKGVPNLDLFLQAHAGAAVRVDRGSRPPVMLRNPALTVAISPQPDVLESLSDKPGFRGRGLIARILYGLPASPIGFRELKPAPCPSAVEQAYGDGIDRLLKLAPPNDEAGLWLPWRLRFSPQAYDAWKVFQRAIEILMREGGKLYYLKDWGSKLPGAAARIAGVLHCVLVDPTESTVISEGTVERALNLVTPLMDHTLAVFNLMERDKVSEDAQKILDWIRKQGEPSFTARDCFCAHQSRFKTMDGIRLAISILEQHYCIRPRPKEVVSHRPSEAYDVNPKLLEASA